MDHHDVLEQLELAALEPDGFERLMAGDTPAAAAVAGHLAGCESCAGELERLRRAAPLLRDTVRTTPPADLRDRTLALVRERGVRRGAAAGGIGTPAGGEGGVVGAAAGTAAAPAGRSILPWVATIAAAVVISVVASALFVQSRLDQRIAVQERTIAGLELVAVATMTISADPESRQVGLASTGTGTEAGALMFTPTTGELVVVASGLEEPPVGQEYRCWVEIDGDRQSLGRMYFADELAYWVGQSPSVTNVPDGSTFGVSLVTSDAADPTAEPVMTGQL